MKTIYIIYSESGDAGECNLVFDENLKCIDGWSCDDATWRDDYFNGFMEQLGITVKDFHPKLTEEFVAKRAKKFFGL